MANSTRSAAASKATVPARRGWALVAMPPVEQGTPGQSRRFRVALWDERVVEVEHGQTPSSERGGPRGCAVVIEGRRGAYGTRVPQLIGCVAVGATLTQVRRLIAGAIALHVAGMP